MVTDSEYLKNGITTWIHGWKRNGWMTAAKKPVVNQDLWQALDEQVARHKTTWAWTKGHASTPTTTAATNWPPRPRATRVAAGSRPQGPGALRIKRSMIYITNARHYF